MKPVFSLILLLAVPSLSSAQGELRSRAIALLERANAVSLAPNYPNLERVDTFRVLDPAAKVREGSFSRVVLQGVGRREEIKFGDYNVVSVWKGPTLITTRGNTIIPPEVLDVILLTPIRLGRFDNADVINAITDKQLGGRMLHCIQFDTIVGQRRRESEICVDAATGVIVSSKFGDDFIQNSDFFSFAGALVPAKIEYSILGSGPKLEITQTMTALEGATANVLAAPPDAATLHLCATYRRPIGQFMPQPPEGTSGRDYDVVIRGMIGGDGKVHGPVVQSSPRADLNAEALTLIAQWTFSPAMCNGKPNTGEASFVLHFHGR